MNKIIMIAGLLGLAACTEVDLAPQLTQIRTDYDALATGLEERLAEGAKEERARVLADTIAAGNAAIEFDGDCTATIYDPSTPSRCELVERFDASADPGSAVELQEFIAMFDVYLLALEGIASSAAAEDAQTQAAALIAAFGATEDERPLAFATLGEALEERASTIDALAGFLIGQAQMGVLRRTVTRGEQFMDDHLPTVEAHLADYDTALIAAVDDVLDARAELLAAERAEDPERYERAVQGAYATLEAYRTAVSKSPTVHLNALRRSHTQLFNQLEGGGDVDAAIDLLEELNDLNDTARMET